MPAGGMHAANPEKSDRLRRTLAVLRNGNEVSSRDLQERAGLCAPGTVVSELRRAGYPIRCRYVGRSTSGEKTYAYRLDWESFISTRQSVPQVAAATEITREPTP